MKIEKYSSHKKSRARTIQKQAENSTSASNKREFVLKATRARDPMSARQDVVLGGVERIYEKCKRKTFAVDR